MTDLFPDRRCEITQPTLSWVRLDYILAGIVVDDGRIVLNVRVLARIVVDGSQLDDLSEEGDGAIGAQVLVPDDGFADGICLVSVAS